MLKIKLVECPLDAMQDTAINGYTSLIKKYSLFAGSGKRYISWKGPKIPGFLHITMIIEAMGLCL